MPFVERNQLGHVVGQYIVAQKGFAEEFLPAGHPDLAPSIQEVRARRIAQVTVRYLVALEAGLAYGGKVLQIREQDQGNITAMGNEARWAKATGAVWPSDFAWRMADDTSLPLDTADKCIAMALAAKAEVIRLRKVKWAHADTIRALQDVAAVEAYDIETGW